MEEEQKQQHVGVQNNFYGPVGQYIEHVEHNHFGMGGDGSFQFGDASSEDVQRKLFPDLPTREEMAQAVNETIRQGLWWSNRSWAVVYRVYQLKGYIGGFTTFVREVETWGVKTGFDCNYDAIQKSVTNGKLAGQPDKWEAQGAQKQAVKLAKALLEILDKKKEKIQE